MTANDWYNGSFNDWVWIPKLSNQVFIEISHYGEYELFSFNGEKCNTSRELKFKNKLKEIEEIEIPLC